MRRAWAGAAITGAAAGAASQLLHARRVATDPARRQLEHPADGQALSFPSADGTELHAEQFGPPDAQLIVLVHGWAENLTVWTPVIRELTAAGFRVIALDLRGHGKSKSSRSGEYSVSRFGEDVEAALEACVPDGRQAVIAGHSLGAMAIVAWAEHRNTTGRIGAAALINTGLGELVAQHLLVPVPKFAQAINKLVAVRGFMGSRAPLPRFSTPVSYGLIRYIAFGEGVSPAQVAFFERMLLACPPHARAATGIALSEVELHHALPRLDVPTIVIAGERDRLTPPSHARRIAELLPRVHRLEVLDGCGHMAPLERPREVSRALAAVAELARGRDTLAA